VGFLQKGLAHFLSHTNTFQAIQTLFKPYKLRYLPSDYGLKGTVMNLDAPVFILSEAELG